MTRSLATGFLAGLFGCAAVQAADNVVFVIDSAADGLLQTAVTEQWYGKGLGRDWRHLQVKDHNGNPVPFRFVQHVAQPTEATEDNALPLFFIGGADDDVAQSLAPAIIRVTPESIDIMTAPSQARPVDSTAQYLVDLREQENKPQTLVFDWDGEENRIYPLTVQYSNDLSHWQNAGIYTLTKLIANDTLLEQNAVTLPGHVVNHAYLKLSFDPAAKVVISKLYGRHVSLSKSAADTMQWQVSGALAIQQTRAATGQHERTAATPVTAWEYQRTELTPATAVFIDFQDQTFVGGIRLLTKNPDTPYWQLVSDSSWHHVHYQGRWYSSAAIRLNQHVASQWRIETSAGINPQSVPLLRFSAPQWHFQVLANGPPPYHLIRTDIADVNNLGQMQQVFATLGLDSASDATDVDIAARLAPMPVLAESSNWQYLAFWILLVGATVVLLYFVVRLFRSQNTAGS